MARRKRRVRRKADEVTIPQVIELMLGPKTGGLRHFRDDGHAQDVWGENRDRLFGLLGEDVLRCWAYKRFELGDTGPRYEYDEILAKHDSARAEAPATMGG